MTEPTDAGGLGADLEAAREAERAERDAAIVGEDEQARRLAEALKADDE